MLLSPIFAPDVVSSPLLAQMDWLSHGFSTRTGGHSTIYRHDGATVGELNLGFTASDPPEAVRANRACFSTAITGGASFPFATLKQVHSADVVRVIGPDGSDSAQQTADGMVSCDAGFLLAIQTADCLPVLLADRRQHVVGALHAGWRGTVKNIVEAGIAKMREEFQTNPEDLIAAIGPGIGPCCFEVGDEVIEEFRSGFTDSATLVSNGRYVNLAEANRRQLVNCGLPAESISVHAECTKTRKDRYFSYRGENGFTGRMFSVIGIRS